MEKIRLDLMMEDKGFAHSRSLAQKLIMAGSVRVNGQLALKPSAKVFASDKIEVISGPRFVSRGGEKLLAALEAFSLSDLSNSICVDVGASTGGFTDCLLQHGAEKVYAVDVGYGVLDWKIRNDPRVVVLERTNGRYIEGFDDRIDLVTIDASFISLQVFFPVIKEWFLTGNGEVIALIKPQFEAGRVETARGSGVIRDPEIHKNVLSRTLNKADEEGYSILGLIRSPLTGPKGNIEFLVHLVYPKIVENDYLQLIASLFCEANTAHDDDNQVGEVK